MDISPEDLEALKRRVAKLERISLHKRGAIWRYLALAFVAPVALWMLSPQDIETRWGRYTSQGSDVVGIVGAIAAAYGVWKGRKEDADDDGE